MTPEIEPATSAEDWAVHIEAARDAGLSLQAYLWAGQAYPARTIALANAALPDSDPRKITRHHVERLRMVAATLHMRESGMAGPMTIVSNELNEIAEALESYLPPEV